ncbi:MAG TPA: adenylate/guanylate cyclase domain-containing protein [Candidatus Acidoferrales bacterium]|nr:adenylate/guanylate cyclase domain-containing protein [Candidatus Acidoferrales bacterium]
MRDLLKSESKFSLSLGVGAVAALVVFFFIATNLVSLIDRPALDNMFRLASHPQHADTSVVIAAIDQKSLNFFDRQQLVGWPWPREFYAILVDYFKKGGAKAVIFDMDFSNRLNIQDTESDDRFANSIESSANVVLASVLIGGDSGGTRTPISRISLTRQSGYGRLDIPDLTSAVLPAGRFMQNCRQLGVANYIVDVDGVTRRIPLLFQYHGTVLPQLALAGFAVGENYSAADMNNFLHAIPTDRNGDYLINWYGKGGPDGVFKYYSIGALIVSAAQIMEGRPPEVSPAAFKDKYVIVGGSAVGLMDFKATPFTIYEPYPGMEIHATVLSNFLQGDFMREAPLWISYALAAIFALVISWAFFKIGKITPSSLVVVASIAGYIVAVFIAFYNYSLWLPFGAPILSIILGFSFSGAVSYVTEGRRRRELRRVFNRYMSPRVVDEILTHPNELELGGKEMEATVFFSDIKNFTGLSEKMSPREVVANLNNYFTLTCDIVLDHGGMLDKYIGDAIMAVFGAPLQSDKHAINACLAAIEVQDQLKKYYSLDENKKGPVFETRIGLNSGKMVIGNIGSLKRLDYTAIGDNVNLASRLEGVNKEFGTKIIVSESTYEQVKDSIEARELDLIKVKGKQIPIRIYELICEKGKLPVSQAYLIGMFHEALYHYRLRKWKKASEIFREILRISPDDGPSKTYAARCKMLEKTGVPKGWDRVFVMTTK